MAKKHIFKALMAAALAVLGLAFAGQAGAAAPVPKPVPGTEGPQVPTVVVEKQSDIPKAVQAVRKASASASGNVQVTVLSNFSAKGMTQAERKRSRCWRDEDGFWNTGRNAAGKVFTFWDKRPSLICIVNGKQVRAACKNPVFSKRPALPVVKGVVVLVSSFGKYRATIKKTATATARDWCGSAKASAQASATVSGRTRLEARGNARLLASVKAVLRASVKASAQVNCGPKAQPTPPGVPPKFTTLLFEKWVFNAAGQRIQATGSFPVTISVPGSTLNIGVPGTGERVVLRDSAGNPFRFGANAVVRACEDESVLGSWVILVARCYEATTSAAGGEIVFVFKNQARPAPPPVTPQQPTPTPTPQAPSCPTWNVESPKDNVNRVNGTASGGVGTITFNWGDGNSTSSAPYTHDYPRRAPGPAGSGVTYVITVTATLGRTATLGSQTIGCGSRNFFVPDPPPSTVSTTGSTGGSGSGGSSGGSGSDGTGGVPKLP